MFKVKHRTLISLSGLVWLGAGIYLLTLGLNFILDTLKTNPFAQEHFSLLALFSLIFKDSQQGAMILITVCLFVGYFKGRFVLGKSVKRQVLRIVSMPSPVSLRHLYSKGYYVLLASMIALGVVMRFLPISLDTRGAIDVTIGSALINGSLLYFRYATTYFAALQKNKN